jgi:hypothetical protein
MSDLSSRAAPALLVLTVLAASPLLAPPLRAQGKQLFESHSDGYRLFVNKAIKAVPTEPNERQALAKWGATLEFKDKQFRGKDDCTVMLVRIRKSKGPTTTGAPDGPPSGAGGGDGDKDKSKEEEKSVRAVTIEELNSGTTVEEFLKKRGIRSDLKAITLDKPLKSRDGAEFSCKELTASHFDDRKWEVKDLPYVRTFLLEDEAEYFGFVALGPFVDPWRDIVEDMCKSFQRIALGGSDGPGTAAGLTNVDFREQVRKKLVKGWEAFDTEHFIFVTNTKDKTLIEQIQGDLELMRASYIKRFPPAEGVDLERVISAVRFCTTYEDYLAYGGPDGTGGYWNQADEELVLVDVQTLDFAALKKRGMPDEKIENLKKIHVLDVLYHEAMHQYFFYANGNLAPASWFNEGYGEVFGGSVPDRRKGEIAKVDKNKFRLFWIKQCQRTGRWPDLRAFLQMTQGEFYGPSILQNYAFAWSFCFYLEELRQDPKSKREWREIPDTYLANLREATKKKREELHIDAKDKQWLLAYQNELQKDAFDATFKGIDLPLLEKAWIETIKKWK